MCSTYYVCTSTAEWYNHYVLCHVEVLVYTLVDIMIFHPMWLEQPNFYNDWHKIDSWLNSFQNVVNIRINKW